LLRVCSGGNSLDLIRGGVQLIGSFVIISMSVYV